MNSGARGVFHNHHAWCRGCVVAAAETATRNITESSCMPPPCCGDSLLPTKTIFSPEDQATLEEAVQRVQDMSNTRDLVVDRTIIRMAMRCHCLVMRQGGCNHITCICGHDFCIICAGDWPRAPEEHQAPAPLCHPFYGAEDEHVLQIPPKVQARLAEVESRPPAAVGVLFFAHRWSEGELMYVSYRLPMRMPWAFSATTGGGDLLYTLRRHRELTEDERNQGRCDVCGRNFRAFLLQCISCRTLLCLGCRDRLCAERYDWQLVITPALGGVRLQLSEN
ncbi:hypothetical protein C7999DRAFT_41747 [Corynascus novoguineensis]|uniref:RING-type domain-containing protein n=1 Tax=Corynascus novoguineensis TaxID=1126955 RepID=A0AAN7HII7_9PEZI|nr:hypothetical protein C7999DRAFT_41747 [Corynascus novoguineensis]